MAIKLQMKKNTQKINKPDLSSRVTKSESRAVFSCVFCRIEQYSSDSEKQTLHAPRVSQTGQTD